LKSFFFVPANNTKFIEKSQELPSDFIVYDLEDSILKQEFDTCLKNLSSLKIQPRHYVRFRFFDDDNKLDEKKFEALIKIGFTHFIVPKFVDVAQTEVIKAFLMNGNIDNVDFLLLVENPLGFFNLFTTLKSNFINITGLGLGSHDYCNTMGMQHTSSNLYFARQIILNHAKAFNLDAIDTVSVNFENDSDFHDESYNAFQMGFTGKFLIHPRQLKILNEIKYYTDEEVQEAINVYPRILDLQEQKSSIFRYNGKVYEKPHINRIINIIKWKNSYGNK